ncbi:hypothetical protein LXK86_00475, partial [Klebsiella pneumoniae]|uniref:hypothetical protein n=1 Tax=Klebsiella pneumoniae TaxID=573 RepID=UPI001F1791FA
PARAANRPDARASAGERAASVTRTARTGQPAFLIEWPLRLVEDIASTSACMAPMRSTAAPMPMPRSTAGPIASADNDKKVEAPSDTRRLLERLGLAE